MNSMKTTLIIATLDTKCPDTLLVKKLVEKRVVKNLVMDTGILGDAYFTFHIPAHKVAEAA